MRGQDLAGQWTLTSSFIPPLFLRPGDPGATSGTGLLLGESGCSCGHSSKSVVDLIFLSYDRSVNISGWTGGSSLLSLGLTVGQAMAVTVVGNLLVSAAVVGTGMIGAKWCVSFLSFLSHPFILITCLLLLLQQAYWFPCLPAMRLGNEACLVPSLQCVLAFESVRENRPTDIAPPISTDRIILSFTWCALGASFNDQESSRVQPD